MNPKNEIAKKDLHLAYSKGNCTAYPANIEVAAWYLSAQYPNNKPGNQCKNKQRKGDDPKSEDKDNIMMGGTTRAHVEDTTTNKDTTNPRHTPQLRRNLCYILGIRAYVQLVLYD